MDSVLEVPYSAHHVERDIEECLRANLEARSGVDITLWSYTESIHRESTESARLRIGHSSFRSGVGDCTARKQAIELYPSPSRDSSPA